MPIYALTTRTWHYTIVFMRNDSGPLTLSYHYTNPADGIAEFEQLLLSNSGEDAFETAIKLLFAKLADEIEARAGVPERFRIHDSADATYRAIVDLYGSACRRWTWINGSSLELAISPSQLTRCLRPLVGWQLHGSDLSWLDATLERLVARDAKGALGQYFTPRAVIRLCVEVLNPRSGELVIDPACGSGGFLFEAVRHAKQVTGGTPDCLGIDFSARALKVATLLASALEDSGITISSGNSLDGRQYLGAYPAEWKRFLIQQAASSTAQARSWGAWNKLGCDVLFTNPPFAGDIDEPDLIEAYDSQREAQSKKAVSREHLFLERAVDLLRPGGRLAIVLPQGILANSSSAYLRRWLFQRCRVLAVIGLHPFAFLPYTGVKTSILFLEKPVHGVSVPDDYPIYFAISTKPGKDSSGRSTGNADYCDITSSLKGFLADQKFPWAQVRNSVANDVEYEIVKAVEVKTSTRLDAEHYDPHARTMERRLKSRSAVTIGDVTARSVPRFKKQQFEDISYVDIGSVDERTGSAFPSVIAASEAPSRASYLVGPGDVLVSTVRPDRNVVALLSIEETHPAVASNGFCVLRSEGIPAELLFAYCKTDTFRRMLTVHATASMYPTVGDRDILRLPFLPPPEEVQNEVVELIRSSQRKLAEANAEIRQAISLVESAVSATSTSPST